MAFMDQRDRAEWAEFLKELKCPNEKYEQLLKLIEAQALLDSVFNERETNDN